MEDALSKSGLMDVEVVSRELCCGNEGVRRVLIETTADGVDYWFLVHVRGFCSVFGIASRKILRQWEKLATEYINGGAFMGGWGCCVVVGIAFVGVGFFSGISLFGRGPSSPLVVAGVCGEACT